ILRMIKSRRMRWAGRAARMGQKRNAYRILWGYVKNIVYRVIVNDLQHLKVRIRDAVVTVTPNMIQVWIFVVPALKSMENVIYAEKTFIFSLCNDVTH
ncbi:hypothetical protein B7P43_G12279, partial [Cryptotermes secundus]